MDWATKGLWLATPAEAMGRKLFDGAFTWPAMVIRRSAVEANIATMAAYCARHGLEHAPHGKTTMAPTLFQAQLDAGAWGITVATANQALVARRLGIARVLLANELLDAKVLRWAAEEAAQGWEFLCYVDSPAGVEVAQAALAGTDLRLRVLVELGFMGGRTGCRSVGDAVAVARAAQSAPNLDVAGVSGFEGMLPSRAAVAVFLASMVEAGRAIQPLCAERPILSAGGSAHFDAIADILGSAAREHDWRVILRSGSYVTHDHVVSAYTTPFIRVPAEGKLTAALEVWAQVLSTPEPGLALIGAGKRDVPIDEGMPIVLGVRGHGGAYRQLPDATIERTNDQHAYLFGADLTPGELVRLGISHPCTAFDKWRVIPVLDDDDRVVDLLDTYF